MVHLIATEAEIPKVINRKNVTSSKGDLTGFLNLTIDKAPIMPSERAILPEITEVIT
tara:strand:+ start:329 stop:499 length:171 start_codon:yes stop_codon:yes gene_type:complete